MGYQFNQYLALEAGYISFGQAKADTSINDVPVTISDTLGGFDANLKGTMPINNKFNVFAKFGVVNMHDDEDVSNNQASLNVHGDTWSPLLGAGAAYNVTKNVALTVQDAYALKTTYQKNGMNINMPAANAVLAGMSFKFNMYVIFVEWFKGVFGRLFCYSADMLQAKLSCTYQAMSILYCSKLFHSR